MGLVFSAWCLCLNSLCPLVVVVCLFVPGEEEEVRGEREQDPFLNQVEYEDEESGLIITRLEQLQRMGRFKIQAGQRLRLLDLAGGIGTALMGVLEAKAGFHVESYMMCEVDPVSRGVLSGNSWLYAEKYSGRISVDSFKDLESVPQDLFVFSREAGSCFRGMDQLPNLVFATVPCTEGSVAGLGRGASTHRGKLFKHAATVVGSLMEEYARRGWWTEGCLAPCGWIFETAPMKSEGEGGAVTRMKEAYSVALG